MSLNILPHRNEAIARVRNGTVGLTTLFVVSMLFSGLPSLPVALYTILTQLRRRTNSHGSNEDDEELGSGGVAWMCILEIGIAAVLMLNIVQGAIALQFPPKPIAVKQTPMRPKSNPKAMPKSPSSGLAGLSSMMTPQRQKTFSPAATLSPLSHSTGPYHFQNSMTTPSKSGPGIADSSSLPPTKSPLLSSSLMNRSIPNTASPVVSAYKGKHAGASTGRALDGSFLSRLAAQDWDDDE